MNERTARERARYGDTMTDEPRDQDEPRTPENDPPPGHDDPTVPYAPPPKPSSDGDDPKTDPKTDPEAETVAHDPTGEGDDASRNLGATQPHIPGLTDAGPESIPGYRIIGPIGRGGMGVVYEAEQDDPRRRVALKLIKLGMDTRQVIARFEAERQALALMDHPCVAKVFDAGSTPSGRPYFVMELVEGAPILEYCDENRLGTRARLEMFAQVCDAIQHAHQKGIIHRDIKPSNVLVAVQDGRPVPKVIDFGIAKAANTELTQRTLFTEHGQVIGTPAYMSPEHAEHSSVDIDTRSDVYALGVLLYELLTGTTPFPTEELLRNGYAEMMRIIREDEPRRPSTQLSTLGETATSTAQRRSSDVPALTSQLKGDLDWITLKCLEKDRGRRYESASALSDDIARHLADEPVLAGPRSKGYTLRKFVRRNRVGVVVGSALVSAVVLGLAGTSSGLLWALDEREKARDASEAERLAKEAAQQSERLALQAEDEAERRARDLETIADFQAKQLSEIDASSMGGNIATTILTLVPEADRDSVESALGGVNFTDVALRALDSSVFEPTLRTIESELKEQPEIAGRLFQTVGRSQSELGLHGDALASYRRAIESRSASLGPEHELTLHTRARVGAMLTAIERFDDAIAELDDTLSIQRRVLPEGHEDIVNTLLYLTRAHEANGDLERAESRVREGVEIARALDGDGGEELAIEAVMYLGYVLRARGELREARQHFEEVYAYRQQEYGPDDPETLTSLGNLVTVLGELGDYEGTLPYYERIYEGRRLLNGENHIRTLTVRINTVTLLWRLRRLEEAESLARDVLARSREQFGAEHTYTLTAINTLGLVLDTQLRDKEALALYTEALETSRRVFGDAHPRTLQSINNSAKVLRRLGRLEEAQPLQFEVLAGARQLFGDRHPNTLVTIGNTGVLLSALGRYAEAEKLFRESLEGCREIYGDEHPETLLSLRDLAKFLTDTGRAEEAFELCEERVSLSIVVFGEDDPRHADSLRDRARVSKILGRDAVAIQDLRAALALLSGTEQAEAVRDELDDLESR